MGDTAASTDRPCAHESFFVQANVARVGEADAGSGGRPKAYMLELTVRCEDDGCGERFRFSGVRAGMSYDHPMCSPDETELRAPIRPASADPDFGTGLPGFAINQVVAP